MATVVHIVGTGTIGEPLIGLFTDFADRMGIDEVTFHKRTPLVSDRAKLEHLMARGAKLAVDPDCRKDFEGLGHTVTYGTEEALERASVVIDCTPAGNANKDRFYSQTRFDQVSFLAQGSEFGFGKPYARGVNDDVLDAEEDRFIQIVSCNTHNITTLVKTLCEREDGSYDLEHADFVCIRRANDVSQAEKFIPSPMVGAHDDDEFGTHHARDAYHLFKTQALELDLFSSALKVNTPVHALDLVSHAHQGADIQRGSPGETAVQSSRRHDREEVCQFDLQLRSRPRLLRPHLVADGGGRADLAGAPRSRHLRLLFHAAGRETRCCRRWRRPCGASTRIGTRSQSVWIRCAGGSIERSRSVSSSWQRP